MNGIGAQVWSLALELAWRGSCLVAVFFVLRALVAGRVPARWLFLGWVAVGLRLVLPLGVPTKWSPFNWVAAEPMAATAFAQSQGNATDVATPRPTSRGGAIVPTATAAPRGFAATELLGVFWLGGAIVFLTVQAIAVHRQLRRWRQGEKPMSADVRALIDEECAAAGCRVPSVCTSPRVPVPAISGLLRPTLWLPAELAEQVGESALRDVIRHELAHWRRGDLWAQELFALVRGLHWWNPLVWLAMRTARADCEIACDEFVMQRTCSAEPSAYGASLLKVLGAAGGRTGTSAALGVFETRKQLKRRILMIAKYRTPSLGRTLSGMALVAAVVALAATRELRAEQPTAGAGAQVTTTAPAGWWENGNAVEKYVVGTDATQGKPAPSAYVKSIAETTNTFGGMMQSCDAAAFRGKRVRFSGLLKTRDAAGGACLWLRVDGADGKSLAFDNMQRQPVTGTKDWTPAEIVLEVPEAAATLNFGFFLMDTGQAWVSALAFAEAGREIAVTDSQGRLPEKPTNLGFAAQAAK
ncbi:MAG TPA: M56 family metallopeptidase [Opitutaceae bacterium]|nr:M56 family metallopeptidase [Opitutaceae bacterium]